MLTELKFVIIIAKIVDVENSKYTNRGYFQALVINY